MRHLTSPNARIVGPLPRKDILAVCQFLNRQPSGKAEAYRDGPDNFLDRLAAAARMQ